MATRFKNNWQNEFAAAEAKYNLPPGLLTAMAQTESAFNPEARSKAGAYGLMQFMPGTAAEYGVNVKDPVSSIWGAAKMMHWLYNQFGNWEHAVMAYNAGPGNIRSWLKGKYQLKPETQQYPGKVFKAAGYSYSPGKLVIPASGDTTISPTPINEPASPSIVPSITPETSPPITNSTVPSNNPAITASALNWNMPQSSSLVSRIFNQYYPQYGQFLNWD